MTEADRRLTSRIAKDHGLTEEALAKAANALVEGIKEQKRKPKSDRMSVGE